MNVEQVYQNYEKMVHKMCWSISRKTGILEEDLFGEAMICLCNCLESYEPQKSSISTYIYVCVHNHLKIFVDQEMRYRTKNLVSEEIFDVSPYYHNEVDDQLDFQDLINSLTPAAMQIVEIIFNNTSVSDLASTPKKARGEITEILRHRGWSWSLIWATFKELKNIDDVLCTNN